MSFILGAIVLLSAAVSPIAESKQIFQAIDQSLNQIHEQTLNLNDFQAKNPPCDPIRCY